MNPWGAVVIAMGILMVYVGIRGNYAHIISMVSGK